MPTVAAGPRITAVCLTRALQQRDPSTTALTGIDKAAVDAVTLTETGIQGDRVLDTRFHGGHDKAVYAYADEDAGWWADQLGHPIPPGRFGENLRTAGLDLVDAVIGERWRIGADVVVEVSEPRTPCRTFQHHMDRHHPAHDAGGGHRGWVRRFTEAGRTGTYLRVVQGGVVAAGDPVAVVHRPAHAVTVGGWFQRTDPADARALLAADGEDGFALASALRAAAQHVAAR